VVSLGCAGGLLRAPARTLRAALRLGQQLQRQRVDVVHGLLLEGNTVARLASRRARARCVCSYHTSHLVQPVEGALEAWTRPWVHASICVSQAVASLVQRELGVDPARTHVVHNGARADGDAVPPDRLRVLGFLGRLHADKGLDLLLRALAGCPQRDLRLRVAGDGEQGAALQALADRLGLSSRVDFVGRVADARGFLRGIDALVLPSRHEGLSVSALEAMACARPVIAADVSGNRELIVDGETGLLVPPDDVAALTRALSSLHRHPALAGLGEAARARVARHFDEGEMVRRTVRIWQGLVAAPLPGSAAGC
jgi:glycosyltransferase involved in cell wall biosynthesis